jgi:hypothetical protein
MTATLNLQPQYPITRVGYSPLKFTVTHNGSGSPPFAASWTLTNQAGVLVNHGVLQSTTRDLTPIELLPFGVPGDYKLSVKLKANDSILATGETTIAVIPESYDDANSFISYGVDGKYYLVVLKPGDGGQSLIRPLPGLPDGFTSKDIGTDAPLATAVPQGPGASFITCVLLNLQSSKDIQSRLASRGK